MAIIKTISDLLWGMPLIVLILLAGIIFTVGSKFFQIAHLKHILKNTIGTLFSKKDNGKGMMKPLEVISIAVGGAVGVGNIGGVATAIAVGGPGAAFWIWVAAFLGMMMKMAEVSLAVYYRSKDEKGGYYGGPTYYMEKGLGRDKGFKFWGVLAVIFGIGIFGNVFSMQNFTVAQSVNATFGIPMLAVGLVYVGLTYLATVREIPWLGKLAAKVVPPMCVFYLTSRPCPAGASGRCWTAIPSWQAVRPCWRRRARPFPRRPERRRRVFRPRGAPSSIWRWTEPPPASAPWRTRCGERRRPCSGP